MQWNTLAEHLFGPGHQIRANGDFLEGHALVVQQLLGADAVRAPDAGVNHNCRHVT